MPSAATNQAHDDQKQDGTDGGVEDGADQPGSEMDTELRQQPASDKGAQDSDDDVADDSETGPLHDLAASQPATRPTNNMTNRLSLDMCIW